MSDIGCFHSFRLLIAFHYCFIQVLFPVLKYLRYDCKLLVSLLQQGASFRKEQRLGQASSTKKAREAKVAEFGWAGRLLKGVRSPTQCFHYFKLLIAFRYYIVQIYFFKYISTMIVNYCCLCRLSVLTLLKSKESRSGWVWMSTQRHFCNLFTQAHQPSKRLSWQWWDSHPLETGAVSPML